MKRGIISKSESIQLLNDEFIKILKREKDTNTYPVGIYLLKVNNRNTRTRCKICSKFPNTPLLARLFWQYGSVKILDKHKNKLMWQSYIFIFRRLKNNVTCLFL